MIGSLMVKLCNIAIAVDISSSVTDHEFNIFISKIDEIKKTVNPKETTVISFNTQIIGEPQKLSEEDNALKKLKFKGRGGTDITPVLKWATKNKPTVLVIFTDGDFTPVEPTDKSIPIVWLIHNNPSWKYQWGRVIHYNVT